MVTKVGEFGKNDILKESRENRNHCVSSKLSCGRIEPSL